MGATGDDAVVASHKIRVAVYQIDIAVML